MGTTHRQMSLIVSRFYELGIHDDFDMLAVVDTILVRTWEHRTKALMFLTWDEGDTVIKELTSRVSQRRQEAAQDRLGNPPPVDPLPAELYAPGISEEVTQ